MSDCDRFGHLLVVTYSRPWRRLFRIVHHLRCWDCDLRVTEP